MRRSERYVWGCWKIFDPAGYEHQREEAEFDFMMDAANDARWAAAIESLKEEHGEREFTDEEIEDAAADLDEKWARENYGDDY
jgi:hypothetical protein